MVEWETTTLEKCTDILGDGLHGTPQYTDDGDYAFINGNNFMNGEILIKKDTKRVDYSQYEKYKKPLTSRTLFVSINGTLGNVGMYNSEKIILGKSACYFNVKESVDRDFIYYVVSSPKFRQYLERSATGTTIKNISLKQMREYEFLLPPIEDQKQISSVLKMIDERIKNNRRINENLLQQAVAVFDKFYDTSTNQQPFTGLINVLGGGTPKTGNPEFWDGSIPFFTPKDAGTPYTFKTEKYITESGLEHCNSRLYPQNTAFVTARGTVGKISLAGFPMAMNQSCYALTSGIVDPLLVYFYTLKAVTSLKHKASGAVFDAIVTRDFDGEMINILSDADSKAALSIIKPMMESIHNNSKENIRLFAVRDTLLPKLISGEVDVSTLDI